MGRLRHNWKRAFGFTLDEAKKMARKEMGGRPLRPGYEVCIISDYREANLAFFGQPRNMQMVAHKVYLANEGGSFRLWEWYDVSPASTEELQRWREKGGGAISPDKSER